jgi:hypothetical protein
MTVSTTPSIVAGKLTEVRPILLKTRFEPMPFWHFLGKKWFVAAYLRPADLSVGIQFMRGGVALLGWPVMLVVCDHRKMPSGNDRALLHKEEGCG